MRSSKLDSPGFLWVALSATLSLLPLAMQLPAWTITLLVAIAGFALAQHWRSKQVSAWIRAPITLIAAIVVVAAFGRIGRDTGAGLLATMLALKLLETNTIRDARLVVSFALFGTVASFYFEQGPLNLTLAAAAVLVALTAMAYLSQAETFEGSKSFAPPALRLKATSKLLALSVPLALAGFFLFPRLATPLWGLPGTGLEARTGVSDTMSPGDMAELFADDSPILRVRFQDHQPRPASLYWRGPVLWRFDGRTWERAGWFDSSRPAPLQPLGPSLKYELTQEPTSRRYVFALDVAESAPEGASLNADRTVLAKRPLDSLSRFELSSAPERLLDANLPAPLRDMALELPEGFNPRARALAESWRSASRDPEDIAQKALELFNLEFSYTLRPPLLGKHSVDDFLFETRQGYCEHFASAFAVLMRAAGVPARVVLGYHGGWYSATGNYWLVSNSDAHAWTEIWIEGRGWVRVDPTAAVAPERIESGQGGELLALSALDDMLRSMRQRVDWVRRAWNEVLLGFDARRQRNMLKGFGLNAEDWRVMAFVFASGALIAVLITMGLLLRQGAARGDPLPRAWRRLRRRVSKAGLVVEAHEGPLRFCERATRHFPASAAELEALSQRYIAWRYAGAELDANGQAALIRDLRRFRPRRAS